MQLQEWPFIRYVGKPGFSGWDKFGTLISKFEDKWWDIDIKNIKVSHCDHTKCNNQTLCLSELLNLT